MGPLIDVENVRVGWWRIFAAMADDRHFEYLILDSTIVRAHQHAAGAKKGSKDQVLGRSRGGLSTKIHLAVRGLGRHHPLVTLNVHTA